MRPARLALALAVSVAAQALCGCAPILPQDHNFRYEKLQNYGLGKRVIPNYRRVNFGYAYPEPLRGAGAAGAAAAAGAAYVRPPYRNIYQGTRRRGDRRVYMKRFDYAAKPTGHRIFCQTITDCEISHVAIETAGGVPVLLRGGAGYRHLSAVVKAAAGAPLRGSIKAYCSRPSSPPPTPHRRW